MKSVDVGVIADLLHAGHMDVLQEAAKPGKVTVGLLSDKAAGEYDEIPYLDVEKRKRVIENIRYVNRVLIQETASYRQNLLELKPDYVVHGDDWIDGIQKKLREEVITILEQYGGELREVTSKPMIYDADTGGKAEHFEFTVRSLERTSVSAVIIEDKTGLKKNSLLGKDVEQSQDTIGNFCRKIQVGKRAQLTREFMIIARIESLILEKGMEDALDRATAYIDAGADGITIHSQQKSLGEIFEILKIFRSMDQITPVVVVPTSYNHIHTSELAERGVNLIIYANHMLRAAYPGMMQVAKAILRDGRSLEAESNCMPIKDILELIPGTR